MGLIAAVDRDQIGGERLHLAAVAKPAGIDATDPGDARRERGDQVGRRPVVAKHQHVLIDRGDAGVEEQDGRHVVKRADHHRAGQHGGRLLGRAALGHRQRVDAACVEPEWVHAVDDDLARERLRQRGEQLPVALPRHGHDHHVRCPRRVLVGHPPDPRPTAEPGCRGSGALRAPRADDDGVARGGQAPGKSLPLVAGAAEDPHHQARDIRTASRRHALLSHVPILPERARPRRRRRAGTTGHAAPLIRCRHEHPDPDGRALSRAAPPAAAAAVAQPVGSRLGVSALATTSGGFAATVGRLDGKVRRDEALAHAAAIVEATDLPVSADLENGFADHPAGVAETVHLAAGAGLAGCSVEDFTGSPGDPIYEPSLAAERVTAAAEVAASGPVRLVLTARAENYLHGRPDLADTIARLQAYQEAGADVLYAPGLTDLADIRQVVASVDCPVNVLALPGGPTISELAEAGVRRVSVGSAFAFAALGALVEAATELREQGTYGFGALSAVGRAAVREAFAG